MKVAASILDCDFLELGREIDRAEAAGVDLFHLDVMDGQFVPNISFGVPVVQAIRTRTARVLTSHLMIRTPGQLVAAFARAGSDRIIIHLEATADPVPVLDQIRQLGPQSGIALNPDTDLAPLAGLLPHADVLLLMSVFPGFGGQSFIPATLERGRAARALIARHHPSCLLAVDGGVTPALAPDLGAAGFDILVAGTALYRSPDMTATVARLKGAATG